MTDKRIELFFEDARNVEISKKEVLRYMGYKAAVSEQEIKGVYEECLEEYYAAVSYKCVLSESDISIKDDTVQFEFCTLQSKALSKNLSHCKKAYVFAATTGVGVDRLLKKYSVLSPLKQIIIDAVASAGIEAWCDKINDILKERHNTKHRFSPGYGGVPLCCQSQVLEFLDAQKKIGITLNSSFIMTPQKSVSAFVGIRER